MAEYTVEITEGIGIQDDVEEDDDVIDPYDDYPIDAMNMGEMVDRLIMLKDDIKELNDKLAPIRDLAKGMEEAIKERFIDEGTTGARGKMGSVSVTENIVPAAYNWDDIREFIIKHEAWYLMNKALNAKSYRELLEAHPKGVPGIKSFTRKTINISRN